MDYSKNSLIMFLDSDDYVGSDYVKECVEQFKNNKVDILCTKRTVEYDNGNCIVDGFQNILNGNILTNNEATFHLVSNHISTSVLGKLYSAYLFEELRFIENAFVAEDTALVYKAFEKSAVVYMSDISSLFINRNDDITSLVRSGWTNRKCLSVIRADSFRLNNLVHSFTREQNDKINEVILYDCAGNFLEIYPRIHKSELTSQEKQELMAYIMYIRHIRLFAYFKPASKKEKIKKYCFLIFGRLYPMMYRPFLKNT